MPLEVLAERLKKFLVFVLLFLLAACAAFCLLAARQGHFSSVPAFRAYVLRFGALGPVVLAAVQAIQVILPVLPNPWGTKYPGNNEMPNRHRESAPKEPKANCG